MQPGSKDIPASSSMSSKIFERRRPTQNTEDGEISILDYWKILKRRIFLFAIPSALIVLAVLVYALNMTATYHSEATILIEEQDIPEDFIGATMSNYASQ